MSKATPSELIANETTNANKLNVATTTSSLNSSSPSYNNASSLGATGTSNSLNFTTPNGALQTSSNNTSYISSQTTPPSKNLTTSLPLNSNNSEKKKIGHREVKHGVVLYKKVSTDELKKSIQFGIVHFINERNRDKMDRDLLMQDFQVVETIVFPKTGSPATPAHNFNDFKLKVYAPYGFKYLRRKFNLNEVDFMHALGETDLIEVSNPGASGSVFYKTSNDKYILKTVQYQECEFLKNLLAGYALNLLQNLINGKFSLLPTIYGLFCYQKLELTSMLSDKTNIRVVIMNNILPSDIPIHEKYDLKGSLYNRKASKQELSKKSPTYKDIDFLETHKDGLILDEKHYENIISSLKRDCLILQSFGIMDYSMLLGIHNLEKERVNTAIEAYYEAKVGDPIQSNATPNTQHHPNQSLSDQPRSSITSSPVTRSSLSHQKSNLDSVFNISAVPARSGKGERLLLYFGIIDILQSYRLKKRLEHSFKSIYADGKQISVCHPTFYANRFIEFMTQKVFKKATLKGSPTRKRLTFKLDNGAGKKDPLSNELNQSIGSNENPATLNELSPSSPPPIPIPIQLTDTNNMPKATSSSSSNYTKNIKDFKSIDSVDSVSGLLQQMSTSESKSKLSKFSNIDENDDVTSMASSSHIANNKAQSHNASQFDYIASSNDNVPIQPNDGYNRLSIKANDNTTVNRSPITPIIRHYGANDKTSPHNQPNGINQLNPISLKVETHSPTHLKTFNNYTNGANSIIIKNSNNNHDSSSMASGSTSTSPSHHKYNHNQHNSHTLEQPKNFNDRIYEFTVSNKMKKQPQSQSTIIPIKTSNSNINGVNTSSYYPKYKTSISSSEINKIPISISSSNVNNKQASNFFTSSSSTRTSSSSTASTTNRSSSQSTSPITITKYQRNNRDDIELILKNDEKVKQLFKDYNKKVGLMEKNNRDLFDEKNKLSNKRLVFDQKKLNPNDLKKFYEFRSEINLSNNEDSNYNEDDDVLNSKMNKLIKNTSTFYVVDTFIPIMENDHNSDESYSIGADNKKFLIIDTYWMAGETNKPIDDTNQTFTSNKNYNNLAICPY